MTLPYNTSCGMSSCLLLLWTSWIMFWQCPLVRCSSQYSIIDDSTAEQKNKEPFCPYFANRAPSKEPYLKNCTWYKEYSCCHQEEIEMIFDGIPPPYGAGERCIKYFNFLMCYVCSPLQHQFYKFETLTVCEDFCDGMYRACSDASLKGQRIEDLYTTGREFCVARKFKVRRVNSSDCFTFDPDSYVENVSHTLRISTGLSIQSILLHTMYSYLNFR